MRYLPQGCALWAEVGGEIALTEESLLLRDLIHRVAVLDWHQTGSSGPAPKPYPIPRPAHEQREEEARDSAKAQQWAARQARRAAKT